MRTHIVALINNYKPVVINENFIEAEMENLRDKRIRITLDRVSRLALKKQFPFLSLDEINSTVLQEIKKTV